MPSFVRWYQGVNARHPLLCKAVSTGALFAVGDVISQFIEGDVPDSYDLRRTLRMAAVGTLWTGPVLHVYFRRLSRHPFSTLSPVQLTLLDQTVGAGFLTASFFFLMGCLQAAFYSGGALHEIAGAGAAEVQTNLWPTLVTNWAIWPALNYLNFAYVPPPYRVLWVSFFGVFWNAFLSFKANAGTGGAVPVTPSAA